MTKPHKTLVFGGDASSERPPEVIVKEAEDRIKVGSTQFLQLLPREVRAVYNQGVEDVATAMNYAATHCKNSLTMKHWESPLMKVADNIRSIKKEVK